MKNKKADEKVLWIVGIAGLVLVVVVVFLYIFSQKAGIVQSSQGSCAAKGGVCGTVTCDKITTAPCTEGPCIGLPGTDCADPKTKEGKDVTTTKKAYCCVAAYK